MVCSMLIMLSGKSRCVHRVTCSDLHNGTCLVGNSMLTKVKAIIVSKVLKRE